MRHLTLLLLGTLLAACVDVPARPPEQTTDAAVDTAEDTDTFESDTAVENTTIQSGHYYLVGTTDKPIPTVLRLVTQLIALDDGRVAIAGGEANTKAGAPRNTTNVSDVTIDTTDDGFSIFGIGTLSTDANGDRFLQIEPFRLDLLIFGLRTTYNTWRLQAKVFKDHNGNDSIDGTMSFSDGIFYIGENVMPFNSGSGPITGTFIPPAQVPPGGPELCGNLCGMIVHCDPPANFPDPSFCEEL